MGSLFAELSARRRLCTRGFNDRGSFLAYPSGSAIDHGQQSFVTVSNYERKITLILVSVYLVRMLGLFLLYPVLVLYIRDYQFSAWWLAATVIGLYGLSQAVMQIPMGLISDRWGRRNTLWLGLTMLCLGGLLAGYSEGPWGLFFGRLIQGAGAVSAVTMAFIADEISEPQRVKASALIGLTIGASFVLAMLISPLIAGSYAGLRSVFLLSSGLAALAMLLVFALPAARDRSPRAPEQWATALRSAMPNLALLSIGIFIVHAGLSICFLSLPDWLSEAGLPIADHGWFYVLCIVLVGPWIARSIKQTRRSISGGQAELPFGQLLGWFPALAMTAAWLGFACYSPWLAISLIWLIVLMSFYLYAFTVLEAVLPAVCMTLASSNHRGLVLGVFSSSQFLGGFAGGLIGGVFAQYLGESSGQWVLLILTVAWLIWVERMPVRCGLHK